jgi:hypothetical protein
MITTLLHAAGHAHGHSEPLAIVIVSAAFALYLIVASRKAGR